jgi:fructose-specific phosphotransferase system IIA component
MPVDFAQILSPDRVVDLRREAKEDVLEELVTALATSPRVTDREELLRCILERERTLSTGVGIGVALPHVKIPSITDFVLAVGRSAKGVDFQSIDGQPAHIIVMIGCNDSQAGDYMKVLSRLVRALKDEGFRRQVLLAKSPQKVVELLVAETSK